MISRRVQAQIDRRRKRLPTNGIPVRSLYPESQALHIARAIRSYMSQVHQATKNAVRPLFTQRQDAEGEDVIERLKKEYIDNVDPAPIVALLQDTAGSIEDFQSSRLSSVIGFDISALGKDVSAMVDDWVADNVQMIKTVAERYLDDVDEEIQRAFENGERWEVLSERLQERFGVSESNADRIAITEIGKLNAQLNQQRQTDLGIERYYWRTSNDQRVREEHAEREGQIFSWDDPPEDGHPGEPVRCRCYADPILPTEDVNQ